MCCPSLLGWNLSISTAFGTTSTFISQRLLDGHERRKREHKEKGNGFGYSVFKPDDPYTNTISARYYKDGAEVLISRGKGKIPRRLTPRECGNLMGFPKSHNFDGISDEKDLNMFQSQWNWSLDQSRRDEPNYTQPIMYNTITKQQM